MSTITLTGDNRTMLARDTAKSALRALQDENYLAECEAWAQKWWGLPYAVVRRKTPAELEPQLTEWLNSLSLPPAPELHGNVEMVEL